MHLPPNKKKLDFILNEPANIPNEINNLPDPDHFNNLIPEMKYEILNHLSTQGLRHLAQTSKANKDMLSIQGLVKIINNLSLKEKSVSGKNRRFVLSQVIKDEFKKKHKDYVNDISNLRKISVKEMSRIAQIYKEIQAKKKAKVESPVNITES